MAQYIISPNPNGKGWIFISKRSLHKSRTSVSFLIKKAYDGVTLLDRPKTDKGIEISTLQRSKAIFKSPFEALRRMSKSCGPITNKGANQFSVGSITVEIKNIQSKGITWAFVQ